MSRVVRNRRLFRAAGRMAPLAALLALACGAANEAPARRVVLVRGSQPAVDPGDRITGASRLLVVDAARPEARPRPIAEELAAAGAPAVSFDGGRLIFVGRRAEDDPLGLWSVEIPGGAPEPLPAGDRECGSADLLPDGRIVFSGRVEGPPPVPELASRWALFVLAPETGEVRRITYGLSEIDPAVLADGRILYAQWQPPGDRRGGEGAFALFAVHPDGTGVTAVHGFHDGPTWKLRPGQLAEGDLVFLGGDESGDLRWWRVDRRSPSGPAVDVALSEELPAPGLEAQEVVAARARPRPQGHLSMVDPELASGQVFGVDARPAGRSDAVALRVRSLAGPARSEAVLGTVDLAADGSFFVEVPADLPLLFDVLDAEGRPIAASTTPLWVRPRERRGCVGCHEDPHLAPPNRRPLAVLEPPVDLTGASLRGGPPSAGALSGGAS